MGELVDADEDPRRPGGGVAERRGAGALQRRGDRLLPAEPAAPRREPLVEAGQAGGPRRVAEGPGGAVAGECPFALLPEQQGFAAARVDTHRRPMIAEPTAARVPAGAAAATRTSSASARRLGDRTAGQPAPPDVAARAREPGAVRRVARAAPAAARRARPARGSGAGCGPGCAGAAADRRRRTCSRRWWCRSTATRRVRALNARLLPLLGAPRGAQAGHAGADPLGLRAAGRGAARAAATRRSSSTTASTTSPPSRGSTPRASAPPRSASPARADLVLASAPALAERMRTLSDNVLYAPNVADTDLFATALERRTASTRRSRRCRGRGSSSPARSSRPSSTSTCSPSSRARGPSGRSRSSGRVGRGRPAHRRSRARSASPTSTCSGARTLRRAARRPARRRRRPDPLRDQRPHPQRLPDEGLRVPGGRAAGGARRRCRRCSGSRTSTSPPMPTRPWPRSSGSWQATTTRSAARGSQRALRALLGGADRGDRGGAAGAAELGTWSGRAGAR